MSNPIARDCLGKIHTYFLLFKDRLTLMPINVAKERHNGAICHIAYVSIGCSSYGAFQAVLEVDVSAAFTGAVDPRPVYQAVVDADNWRVKKVTFDIVESENAFIEVEFSGTSAHTTSVSHTHAFDALDALQYSLFDRRVVSTHVQAHSDDSTRRHFWMFVFAVIWANLALVYSCGCFRTGW